MQFFFLTKTGQGTLSYSKQEADLGSNSHFRSTVISSQREKDFLKSLCNTVTPRRENSPRFVGYLQLNKLSCQEIFYDCPLLFHYQNNVCCPTKACESQFNFVRSLPSQCSFTHCLGEFGSERHLLFKQLFLLDVDHGKLKLGKVSH